jgi:hypothetical protein
MTRKPTTKSPDERRLRKQLRELLQIYAADTSKFNTDATIRELLSLIDDEVRRTRMSIAPAVQHVKLDGVTTMRRDWEDTLWERDRKLDAEAFKQTRKLLTCGGK